MEPTMSNSRNTAPIMPARRDLSFGLPADRITDWNANGKHVSLFMNTLSLYFPVGERFFMDSVRHYRGRITDLVTSGRLFRDLGLAPLDAEHDRAMLCGSPQMLADMRPVLEALEFTEGSSSEPGQFVIEKAFVEK